MTAGYALTIAEPLGGAGSSRVLSTFDLNPDILALSFSTGQGGYNGLTLGLQRLSLPDRGELTRSLALAPEGFCHVLIERNGVELWEGRNVRPVRNGGELLTLTAQGYGIAALGDDWYASADATLVSAGPLLKEILALKAPLLNCAAGADEFVDSGLQYARSDFNGLPPSQVVARLSGDGGGGPSNATSSTPYDFLVYNNRVATLKPRVQPPMLPLAASGGATYWIDFDPGVTWDADYTDCVGDVTVADATVPPNTYSAVSSSFVDNYGFMRRIYLAAGAVTAAIGQQLADVYLSLHQQPLVAITVERAMGRGLRLASGAEQPPELVRTGEWIQIGDQPPAYIIDTTVDVTAGTFTLHATSYPRGYLDSLTELQQMLRRINLNLNPLSGAPKG